MPARTIKGDVFTIIVDGKRITVKHVPAKGKRCQIFAPAGVTIESGRGQSSKPDSPDSNEAASGNSPTL